jgi:hypothetical protein
VKDAYGKGYERRPWARVVLVWLAGGIAAGTVLGFLSAVLVGV